MAKSARSKIADNLIVQNRKAWHDYSIEDSFEAGVQLQGWEVKSLRRRQARLVDSYVLLKDGEALLLGCHITPLPTASTHFQTDPGRTRKLLLHKKELAKLFAATRQKGQTCVCIRLYWKGHLVKAEIALARGKQSRDKRASIKQREWDRDQQRLIRHGNR